MKILFLLGDCGNNSLERKLAEEAKSLIAKDAEAVFYDPALPFPDLSGFDGVWIFTHEEEGGCPEELMSLLEERFPFQDVPVVASGIGGKEGGMNAVTEISEFFEERGGRYMDDSEPLCVPLRTARFELGPEEKMDLFFLVDTFLKYCGMDDSESRKIAFETVVGDYFRILKYLARSEGAPVPYAIDGNVVKTDVGEFDCALGRDAPPELQELRFEIDALVADYEIEAEEILPALSEKIKKEW